ncbi:hypothetical protein RB653_003894 [Dictyostelium firmibasis]|uniref:DUF1697 domain-containing protein n=1 Tax=Dictyostelium firmibasis TaxID=79012 RepID=A0AAN7U6H4_9MYCE
MTTQKYIVLVRALSTKIKMKDLKDHLERVIGFKSLKTFFTTGNIILDAQESMSKEEICNEISNVLSNQYQMEKPLMAIFNVDEYKDILSFNPYDKINESKTVIFFPINDVLKQSDYDKDKDFMTKATQWQLVNGVIWYLGPTTGTASDVKIFKLIEKKIKPGSNNEYTFRTLRSSQKILDVANK